MPQISSGARGFGVVKIVALVVLLLDVVLLAFDQIEVPAFGAIAAVAFLMFVGSALTRGDVRDKVRLLAEVKYGKISASFRDDVHRTAEETPAEDEAAEEEAAVDLTGLRLKLDAKL